MIDLRPFREDDAMQVFRHLEPMDHIEAELVRGASASHLRLFADWCAVQGAQVVSLVLCTRPGPAGVPFAVLGLGHTGQAGIAQAALVARDHQRFRHSLGQAAVLIRRRMPAFCAEAGIRRIEARCWEGHPSAARFLTLCGFHRECLMPGFGGYGHVAFEQFAWIASPPDQET
ncbi:MAG: hypothetical protein GYB53_18605 [Rhodobacteraceae bacterium]|nr:hypothetical protein [Paracoccaceae bacterium]MBR9819690.1 hypothetical protein [Paracoccaceae bacterium]